MSINSISITGANPITKNKTGIVSNPQTSTANDGTIYQYNQLTQDTFSYSAGSADKNSIFCGDSNDTIDLSGGWTDAGLAQDTNSKITGHLFKDSKGDQILVSGNVKITGDFTGTSDSPTKAVSLDVTPTEVKTSNGDVFKSSDLPQFKNGTYQPGTSGLKALDDYKDVVTSSGKLTKKGFQAILGAWDQIHKSDQLGAITNSDLFSAISENKDGKFAPGSLAYQAALYLSNNADLLNQLDGADHNGLINQADIQRVMATAPDSVFTLL